MKSNVVFVLVILLLVVGFGSLIGITFYSNARLQELYEARSNVANLLGQWNRVESLSKDLLIVDAPSEARQNWLEAQRKFGADLQTFIKSPAALRLSQRNPTFRENLEKADSLWQTTQQRMTDTDELLEDYIMDARSRTTTGGLLITFGTERATGGAQAEHRELINDLKWSATLFDDNFTRLLNGLVNQVSADIESQISQVRFNAMILSVMVVVGIVLFVGYRMMEISRSREASRQHIMELRSEIEDRQQAETALAESQALLQGILTNIPTLVFVRDREGRFLLANQNFAQLMAHEPEEMIGQTAEELSPSVMAETIKLDHDRQVLTTEHVLEVEETTELAEEERTFMSIRFPIYDAEGTIYAVGSVATDITARKQAEQQQQRLQQEIIEAQQQMIAELSTPIIPIMERVIILPLVGSIDTHRARDITRSLLAGISRHRARVVILDITGVSVVDSGVAAHLDKTIQAARLKGAETIITGITDAVAETIVDLGIPWHELETVRDMQTGLALAMERLRRWERA